MSHDSHLQEAVLAELRWDPKVTASEIGVAADSGIVTLTGRVKSLAEKHAAETAAHRVKGVNAVAEEIEVQLPSEMERTDQEIAAAAADRLAWDVSLARDAVQVQVENDLVTLSGEVEWYFQKDDAEHDVRRLSGVKAISNQITIKPTTNTANISDDITHALHRSWFFDPQTIKVTAQGGKVRLTGTAHSVHDRQAAAATA